jgi:hypothetical protein
MFKLFWLALQCDDWRHDPSEYRKCALLLYQGRVGSDWHKTLGTPDAFRLILLHVGHLNDYHQELHDNTYATEIVAVRTVCILFHILTKNFIQHCYPPLFCCMVVLLSQPHPSS